MKNAYDAMPALVFLLFIVFYMNWKTILCRNEWSLLQLHSLKHARGLILKEHLSCTESLE